MPYSKHMLGAAISCIAAAALSASAAPPTFDVEVITPPPNTGVVAVRGLNDEGNVVGLVSQSDPFRYVGWVWDGQGAAELLPPLPGGLTNSMPDDIANTGLIIGNASTEFGDTSYHAWSLQNGEYTVYPQFGGSRTEIHDENDAGDLVGLAFTGVIATTPVRFVDGQVQQIIDISGTAESVNEGGVIMGEHPDGIYVLAPGEPIQVITPPDQPQDFDLVFPVEINDSGWIIGSTTEQGTETDYAFVWMPEFGYTVLPTPGVHNFARAINSDGMVVGVSRDTGLGDFAWLWTPEDGLINLRNLLAQEFAGWSIITVSDINTRGQITAGAFDPSGNSFDVLLTPVGACPGDFNGDGDLNILDFVAFQAAFSTQDPAADCDDNGQFNILDFICFQGVFQAGCGG